MLTQMELIDAARAAIAKREGKPEPVTYYRIGKELGVTSSYMTNLTKGHNIMSADCALKLAQIADLTPGYVLASIEAERAERDHSETTGTWKALAEMIGGKAASILLIGMGMLAHVDDAAASGKLVSAAHSPTPVASREYCILCQIIGGFGRWLRGLLAVPSLGTLAPRFA